MTEDPQSRFLEMPQVAFPFFIEAIGEESGRVLWTDTVEGPGVSTVPPLRAIHGERVWVRMTLPDGTVYESDHESDQ